MKTRRLLLTVSLLWIAGSTGVQAGWADYLDVLKGVKPAPQTTSAAASLTDGEMISGLKEALGNGTQFAINALGQ